MGAALRYNRIMILMRGWGSMSGEHFGDRGKTLLSTPTPIGKDDVRLEAIGSLEELSAVLRLSAIPGSGPQCPTLLAITGVLSRLIEYVRSGGMAVHLPKADEIALLEDKIARLAVPCAPVGTALTEESARDLHAATVARRAERALVRSGRVYPVKEAATAYLNRLGDFLTALGVFADYRAERTDLDEKKTTATAPTACAAAPQPDADGLVRAVLAELGEKPMIDLTEAKRLIEAVEEYAASLGRRVVIAVTNATGNPIAVHVMDGAYLVSFDVAVKKAYTAVAVRMPTQELGALVAKGGTFQGLDSLVDIVTFGGGVPLFRGAILAGGLGISGGTGEEDHALCEYALKVFEGK